VKAELKREVVGSYQVTGELTFNTVDSLSDRLVSEEAGLPSLVQHSPFAICWK